MALVWELHVNKKARFMRFTCFMALQVRVLGLWCETVEHVACFTINTKKEYTWG